MTIAIYMPLFQDLFGTISLPFIWVLGVFSIGILNIIMIEVAKWVVRKKHISLLSN